MLFKCFSTYEFTTLPTFPAEVELYFLHLKAKNAKAQVCEVMCPMTGLGSESKYPGSAVCIIKN